jgi:Tol biopolymer transport system component
MSTREEAMRHHTRITFAAGALIGIAATASAQTTTRVSVDSADNQANGPSLGGIECTKSMSMDGRFVAFKSSASNLVPDDTNGVSDIFVRDCETGQTTRVSVASDGTQANAESADGFDMSGDGRYVVFDSFASNLVAGDTNGVRDIFLHDCLTGQTTLVSVSTSGVQGNTGSERPVISADGRYVAFSTESSNLVADDTNGRYDVYRRDLQTGETIRASVGPNGEQGNDLSGAPTISADGRYIAFHCAASNFVTPDTNLIDIMRKDLLTGQVEIVDLSNSGTQAHGQCYQASISADGSRVAFISQASDLVPGDSNGRWDVFVRDFATHQTDRISVDSAGNEANHHSWFPHFSADGRFVAFASVASNLVSPDTNGFPDAFVYEMATGVTQLVSFDSNANQGNSYSGAGPQVGPWYTELGLSISGDGRYIAFGSEATNLVIGDTNGQRDVFRRDRFGCGAVSTYCIGAINTTGHGASIGYQGSTSVAENDLVLLASGCPPQHFGVFCFGTYQTQIPFGEGYLCVTGNQHRLTPVVQLDTRGMGSLALDFTDTESHASLITAGSEWNFQFWYRDSQEVGHGFNFTNALNAHFCP